MLTCCRRHPRHSFGRAHAKLAVLVLDLFEQHRFFSIPWGYVKISLSTWHYIYRYVCVCVHVIICIWIHKSCSPTSCEAIHNMNLGLTPHGAFCHEICVKYDGYPNIPPCPAASIKEVGSIFSGHGLLMFISLSLSFGNICHKYPVSSQVRQYDELPSQWWLCFLREFRHRSIFIATCLHLCLSGFHFSYFHWCSHGFSWIVHPEWAGRRFQLTNLVWGDTLTGPPNVHVSVNRYSLLQVGLRLAIATLQRQSVDTSTRASCCQRQTLGAAPKSWLQLLLVCRWIPADLACWVGCKLWDVRS